MRYWIWWNDLIQGPFELDELTLLKAFSEDLPVCMEDREDWLPAGRVADLSSAVEQLRARRTPPLPPPPPPKRSPTITPLQGEFFGEPQGQQPLLESDDDPKGPYAYRALTEEPSPPASYFVGQATMPFHFAHQPQAATAVIEMLRPQTSRIAFAPRPVIKESPVPKEEFPLEEEKPKEKPFISLELLQERPSLAPSFEPPAYAEKKLKWIPWILGMVFAFVALGSTGYWLMDRVNTRSAIAEANRLEPPKPLSISSVSGGRATVTDSRVPIQPAIGLPGTATVESAQATGKPNEKSVLASVRQEIHNLLSPLAKAFSMLTGGTSRGMSQGSPAINQTLSVAPAGIGSAVSSPLSGQSTDASSGESAQAKESPAEKSAGSSIRNEVSNLFSPLAKAFSALAGGASRGVGQGSTVTNQALPAASAGSASAIPNPSVSQLPDVARHESSEMSEAVAKVRKLAGAPPEMSAPSQPAAGLPGTETVEPMQPKETSPEKSDATTTVRKEINSLISRLAILFASLMGRASPVVSQASPAINPMAPAASAGAVSAVSGSLASAPKALGYGDNSVPPTGARSSKSKLKKAVPKKKPIHRNPTIGVPTAAKGKKSAVAPEVSQPAQSMNQLPGVENDQPESASTQVQPTAKLPGVKTTPSDVAAAPGVATTETSSSEVSRPNDPWKGHQNEAIALVMAKTLPKSKITIGNQARAMLQEMHEKELMHAAETGERLYLPDKLAWAALQEDGPHYRVYLNFLSWQANGERVQSRSYQFLADLKTKEIKADDPATQQDLLTQPAELTFKHNPMATDIDSILGGVDIYNKHKVQMIIVKKNNRNREDRKKIETALAASAAKVKRAVIYFRRTYTEKALQNVAKAYDFLELLKG